MIILREGNMNFLCLAALNADQLILESRNERIGAKLQLLVLCGTAFERPAVNFALKVECHGIVLCSLLISFQRHGAAVLLLLLLQSLLEILIGDRRIGLRNLNALVLSQCYFRLYGYFCREDKGLAFADLGYTDLRCGDDIQTAFLRSIAI